MEPSRSNTSDESKAWHLQEDDPASNDSTWGEGSASALQSLRQLEQHRARNKPSEERPSND
jgi:hypothetical protein